MNKYIIVLILFLGGYSLISAQISPECDVCGELTLKSIEPDGTQTTGKCMYRDADGDGFGTGTAICITSTNTTGYSYRDGDCNDSNASVYPRTWYIDADRDGVGSTSKTEFYCATTNTRLGWSLQSGDCDDNNANLTTPRTWYLDADGDGFGTLLAQTKTQCTQPSGYVLDKTDCDDGNASIRYITWYKDQDGDGLGDPSITTQVCDPGTGWVQNSNDKCPNYKGATSDGCPTGTVIEARNSVYAKGYLINGKVISESKNYYDDLGKLEQGLSLDIKTNKVWASQTMYDSQGRPALQTLGAPAYSTNTFLYKENFVKRKSDNQPFSTADFETTDVLAPSEVSTEANTVGNYYSEQNTTESLQDITDRPYSRTIYSELNPGAVKQVIGGNKQNGQWQQGYSFSMPATQEMYYVYGYDYFPALPGVENSYAGYTQILGQANYSSTYYGVRVLFSSDNSSSTSCLTKTDLSYLDKTSKFNIKAASHLEIGKIYVVQDGTTKFIVQITNRSSYGTSNSDEDENAVLVGGPWSSCDEYQAEMSGYANFLSTISNTNNAVNWLKAGKTVVQDVRGNESVVFTDADGKTLAAARSGGTIKYNAVSLIGEQGFVDVHIPKGCDNTLSFIGSTSNYKVYNLKTEQAYSTTPSTLPAGFYRVEYIGQDKDKLTKSCNLTYIDESRKTINPVQSDAVGVRYKVNYYDYNVNYYNDAGQLTKSYQPLGFNDSCLNGLTPLVSHNDNLKSEFTYNALGQLLKTKSPDEGEAQFKYRKDGQIRFSQNSKQKVANEFSYTNYDNLARPTESGVCIGTFSSLNPDGNNSFSGTRKEQHFTEYDYVIPESQSRLNSIAGTNYQKPTFLSGNVVRTYNKEGNTTISETFYSYDIYGRVTWIVQYIKDLGTKTIDYEYDPITSQVTKVWYQKGTAEQFIHRYTYDSDTQQLVKVETSTDNTTYITHADYKYYETGALKRTELAGGIQGIDYVYNLAGQLKSINHPNLTADKDPGGDSTDLFGLTLDYYAGDYRRNPTQFSFPTTNENQYNGNIKALTWNTKVDALTQPFQYKYGYNENNWLQEAVFDGMGNQQNDAPADIVLNTTVTQTQNKIATNSITLKPGFKVTANSSLSFSAKIVAANTNGTYGSDDYKVSNITYDANGNIKTLHRKKNTENGSNRMDELTYKYENNNVSNRLDQVIDAVTAPTNADDIKTQPVNNYRYNEIGQLIRNEGEKVDYQYNASGLVTLVKYNGKNKVRFYYNDKGFRTKKITYNEQEDEGKTTYYVRDASGSVLAIYENTILKELPIYGATRLGIYNKTTNTSVYQLTDHLGNVRAVIAKNGSNAVALTSATDYYPFGMPMPNRIFGANGYRYAYQGQEKDPETGKEAFQLRLWDGRIGRWLSPDPYGEFHSPYLGMGNNPANTIDPDGGCTECPKDAKDGQIYKHSELGNVTFNAKTGFWQGSDGANIFDDVVITPNLQLLAKNDFYSSTNPFADVYQFNARDLRVAIDVLNGPNSVIKDRVKQILASGVPEPLSGVNYRLRYGDRLSQFMVGAEYVKMAAPLAAGAFGGGNLRTNMRYNPRIVPSKVAPAPQQQPIGVNTTARPGNAIQITMRSDIKSSTVYSYMNPSFKGGFAGNTGFTSSNGIKWSYYKSGGTNPNGYTIKGLTPNRQYIIIRFNQ